MSECYSFHVIIYEHYTLITFLIVSLKAKVTAVCSTVLIQFGHQNSVQYSTCLHMQTVNDIQENYMLVVDILCVESDIRVGMNINRKLKR